jgi:hypothetical protein
MTNAASFFDKVELLQNTLIVRATNDEYEVGNYVALRAELLSMPSIAPFIPEYVSKNRTLDQFWLFIKPKFTTYAERRKFIWDSFSDLLDKLETKDTVTCDIDISLTINDSEEEYIKYEWDKALQRRSIDPEGAITSSRALLETVCKHILDKLDVGYSDGIDIQKLYKLVADQLQLSPDQHNEQVFKQILGGCQSVVNGLGSLRNKFSDAHGKSIKQVKPSKRHASLAVNLSGTMASFLIETYKNKINTSTF